MNFVWQKYGLNQLMVRIASEFRQAEIRHEASGDKVARRDAEFHRVGIHSEASLSEIVLKLVCQHTC